MATTRKSSKSVVSSVDCVVDSAFVPDMEQNKTREVLGDEVATTNTWVDELICQSNSRFDALPLRERMKLKRKEMNIGRNRVVITSASYRENKLTGKMMYRLSLEKLTDPDFSGTPAEDNAGARIENLALFPGERFVDSQGRVHDDGWQWDFFCRLREQEYSYCKGKDIEEIFPYLMSHPFDVWLLKDIRNGFTRIFLTQKSYDNFIDRMAKQAAKEASKAKKSEVTKNDDKPPFNV